jgi:3-deoxy-D-manno-octulosonic acid (KDO) 8-phosphate synthase
MNWHIWFLQQAAQPFFLLAGPNVIESEEHVMKMAKHIKAITTKWATNHHAFKKKNIGQTKPVS